MTTSITDSEFDRTITLRQAFQVLRQFLAQFNARGPQETALLEAWLDIEPDGGTADPAQLDDFLESVRIVLEYGTAVPPFTKR